MKTNTEVGAVLTGAAGWLGKGLAKGLINGLIDTPELPKLNSKLKVLLLPSDDDYFFRQFGDYVEIERGDIRNPDDCNRLFINTAGATLYHTAGIIHPAMVQDFYDVNFHGTKNIINAAEKAGVKRAVIASSNSPIGCNPNNTHRFNEESPFNPYMGYGKSKMKMEESICRIQERGHIETVRIRAPWFYGPYQPARQTLFFEMIRDGKAPIVGDGENKRSMAYIDNLAQGFILAGHSPAANGKVYWIADENPYSMNEIIKTIEDVLESDFSIECHHKRLQLPSAASNIAYALDNLIQGLGMYHQKIHVLSEMNKTIACDIGLAKSELGYRPAIALREGMRRSIEWMFNNGIKL